MISKCSNLVYAIVNLYFSQFQYGANEVLSRSLESGKPMKRAKRLNDKMKVAKKKSQRV